MKKQLLVLFFNIIIIFGSVGIITNLLPLMGNVTSAVSSFAAVNISPESISAQLQSKISGYIYEEEVNTTNTPIEKSEEVMNKAGSKDSNDGIDLTSTPKDVEKLMKNAEKSVSKKDALGKTSEEPYLGGGTVIEYNGVEIQSKIPAEVYKPDIGSLLKRDSDLIIRDKTKPAVLVYHSHTTEAYSLLDLGYYIKSDARSDNPSRNVVRVGDELVRALEAQGFNVIHDTEIHDRDYNSSYDESRKAVEAYLEEYPSIEVTIDLHRDDITYSNKTKVKPTAVIKGKKAARMMIISGCEYGLVKNFPDWEYNLRFDLQVQSKLNSMYGGLMRPILFSQRKYNMYETHNSFLLEIGTDANTLEEACYSARLFGDALGRLMNEKYVK